MYIIWVDLLPSIDPALHSPSNHETPLEPCVSEHAASCRPCAYVARPRTHFLQECVGALPVLFSLPTSQLLTQRMWCICSGCVLSVVTPLEFCFSQSFEPEKALMAAAVAALNSWKQLQKCERKGTRKGILVLFFVRSPPPHCPFFQPTTPPPPIHPHFQRLVTISRTCVRFISQQLDKGEELLLFMAAHRKLDFFFQWKSNY